MYPAAQAEQLDGACERFVKVTRVENLYDVEQFCDVPISILLAYNPSIRNARHVGQGDVIEVPQVYNPERASYMASVAGVAGIDSFLRAVAYVVQPGDTLNDIAARHLVSISAVANVNPSVDWRYVQAGTAVWIPAANAGQPAAPASITPPSPATGSLPYSYGHVSGGASGSGVSYDVTTVMPYQMTPAQQANEKEAPRSLLMINRRTVEPGDEVTVTGESLPANSEVSLYSGPNGNQLSFVKTVTTDSNGRFSESVPVYGNAGGVIFQATINGGEDRLQSPRVGISK